MKKYISLLLILTLSLILIGCAKKKVAGEIVVWWPGGSEAESAAIYQAKELYEAENEGIKIKIVPQSTTNFYMNYSLSLGGQSYPDVAYIDHVYVQRLMNDGSIANLSDYGFDSLRSTFVDSLWEPNTYEDKLYALPMSANVLVTAYNKTLLQTVLGRTVTDEDLPKDWDSFNELAQKILDYNIANNLTGDNAYIPITIPAGTSHDSMASMTFLSYTAREGGTIMSSDLKTSTLNSNAALHAAEKIQELGQKNYTTSVFSEGRFEAGKIAFIEMGPWKITEYERIAEARNIEIEYAPIMPFTENGINPSTLGLYSLVVTNKSINRDIAADFIKFVTTSDTIQLTHNKDQNLMPCTKTAINDEFYQTPTWKVFTEQLNSIVARPGTPIWATIEQTLGEFVTSLISGSRQPSYLNSINYAVQEALNELYEDEK